MSDIMNSKWEPVDDANMHPSPDGVAKEDNPLVVPEVLRMIKGAVKRDALTSNAVYVSTGTGNAYVLTYPVAPEAYVKGYVHWFMTDKANTDAATLNINGLGVKAIVNAAGAALTAGQIASGVITCVVYDGTSFRLQFTHANPTFTGNVTATSFTGSTFTGSGAALTNLNASNIATGTIADARLPTTLAGKTFSSAIAVTGNLNFAAGGERQISFGDAGLYLYGNSNAVGLYYPAASKSPWGYTKSNDLLNFQAGSLQHNGTTVVTNNGGTYSINITGNAGGNANTATTATNANRLLLNGSGYANFHWSGQGGQPTWVWGAGDAGNTYLYNPSNFSVNYANSANYANGAGNANTLGGIGSGDFMNRYVDQWKTSNDGVPRIYFSNGGSTTVRANADPIFVFQNGAGTNASRVRAGGTYENMSDRRTKHDIEDANDIGLENILKMQPRRFIRNGLERVELGWISQEMQQALPDAVVAVDPTDPNEYLYIDEKPIIVALVAAVKQLSAEMTALKRA